MENTCQFCFFSATHVFMAGNPHFSSGADCIAPAGGRLRALCRLVVVALHIVRGLFIVYWRMPAMSRQQRQMQVQRWSARLLRHCGVGLQVCGQPATATNGAGLMLVANHISWLDIEALHAVGFCRFVAKSEVAQWPVVGTLANCAETLYLQRTSRRDTLRVLDCIADSLRAGDTVAVFPEGTTSDGSTLLPFYANLLQAPIDANVPVQPVALQFFDAAGRTSRAPCYIGDDTLLASVWRTLRTQGLLVRLTFGTPQLPNGRNRQQLAQAMRDAVGQMLDVPDTSGEQAATQLPS